MRRGHTTKNSVITTSHSMLLIGSQVNVLRHDERTGLDALTGNAAHDGLDVLRADLLARFHLDVALAVTYKDFTGDFRVGLRPPLSPLGSAQIQFAIIAPSVPALCVAEVNDCPCYPVRHLVRVAWVHFLKHDLSFYGFNLIAFCPVSFSQRAMMTVQ